MDTIIYQLLVGNANVRTAFGTYGDPSGEAMYPIFAGAPPIKDGDIATWPVATIYHRYMPAPVKGDYCQYEVDVVVEIGAETAEQIDSLGYAVFRALEGSGPLQVGDAHVSKITETEKGWQDYDPELEKFFTAVRCRMRVNI